MVEPAGAEMVRMDDDNHRASTVLPRIGFKSASRLRPRLSGSQREAARPDRERPEYFLHLDPLDGTFNAIAGIPSTLSIYISQGDFHFGYVCDCSGAQDTMLKLGEGIC